MHGRVEAHFFSILEEISDGSLLAIVIVGHHFQITHYPTAGVGMGIGQLHDVLTINPEGLPFFWLNYYGTISAVGFLEPSVAVKPVSTALHDGKLVSERFSGFDPVITNPWHTILLIRQDQTVPVN